VYKIGNYYPPKMTVLDYGTHETLAPGLLGVFPKS
jgi:hypothetical protein